jgi:hypothetical protein
MTIDEAGAVGSSHGDDKGLSRREALKRGAMIGGAAFVLPVVSSISMSPAAAAATSGYTPGDTQTPPNGGPNTPPDGNDYDHDFHGNIFDLLNDWLRRLKRLRRH